MNRDEIGKLADIVIQDMRISEALAKQKPMEVKMFSTDFGRCPACDSIVDRVDYYCRYCGQRLE